MTYNLLDEKWIPVLYRNGECKRVGILKAFEDANAIRQIAASNPMDRVAILRFLLALLYWCKGNPPDDMNETEFPSEWFSKLIENRDCFNLLGDGKRFYQDRTANRSRSVTDLLQEIPAGNNFWHFRHSKDTINGLCPACCSMGLLRLPLFSVSGLPNLLAGINGTPPIYVLPLGKTLLETLNLNWISCKTLGTPAWIQPDIRPVPGETVPLLTGLTLLSRRVWLHESGENTNRCISCGIRSTHLILTCEYQTAGKQENELWNDPHVIYTDSMPRKTTKATDLSAAQKFKMDRPWPDLITQIIEKKILDSISGSMQLLIVGFSTKQALNVDVWERTVKFPSVKSSPKPDPTFILQWLKEAFKVPRRISYKNEISSDNKRKSPEIFAHFDHIRPHIENSVSSRIEELLSGNEELWEKAAEEYQPMMKALSESLSTGFTTSAVQYRNHIAKIRPDMRQKPEPDQKKRGKRKKGEGA